MVAACDYVEEGAQSGEAGADDTDAISTMAQIAGSTSTPTTS